MRYLDLKITLTHEQEIVRENSKAQSYYVMIARQQSIKATYE